MAALDVFLSHHHADKAVVEEIAEALKRSGLEPWLDSWHLPAGVRWQPQVADALAACASCAVFVGAADVGAWERQELEVALERANHDPAFRVFLVLLPGAPDPFDPASLSPFLSTRTWVDLRRGLGDPDALARLVNAVRGLPPGGRAATRAAAAARAAHPIRLPIGPCASGCKPRPQGRDGFPLVGRDRELAA